MDSQRFNSQRFNLTHGDTLSKLLQVSVPIVGTQLLLMSYNLVDMFLLGRLSSDAVAASGSAGMYLWLANGIQLIGRMGAEIGVSQFKGRGDREAALQYSHNSLFLATLFGLLLGAAFSLFARPLIDFLNIQEAHVVDEAVNYLRIVGAGIPLSFIASSIAGTFTGGGNSRAPFIVMAIGLAINTILDPIFIFTLGLGVSGAAIATVIGQAAPCIISVVWLLRKKDRPFRNYTLFRAPSKRRIRHIMGWTIPISLESLLFTFIAMLISRHIAIYGSEAIAVARIGSQAESLCWLICLGFSSGITTFVGQNFGAGRWTRIRDGLKKATLVIVAWGLLLSILFFTLGGPIFRLFIPDPRIIEMGATYLWILAFSEVFYCLESVAGGGFRGLGKTAPPSIASISSNILRYVGVVVLADTGLGLNGIWWVVSITAILRGIWVFLWFIKYIRTRPHADATMDQWGT